MYSHDLGLQTMLTEKNLTSKEKRSAVYKERHRVQSYSISIVTRARAMGAEGSVEQKDLN